MKSTSILLILAMVGTGFGQTTSIRQKTGFSCNLPGTTATATWACEFNLRDIYAQPESTCYCEADQIITPVSKPKTSLLKSWNYSNVGCGFVDDVGKTHEVPCKDASAPPAVDVPAIQEKPLWLKPKYTDPPSLKGFQEGCEAIGNVYSPLKGCRHIFWTCTDENRVLLTSVNGRRHSCHLIQDGK